MRRIMNGLMVGLVAWLGTGSALGLGFDETFTNDPSGQWYVYDGDSGRFTYDSGTATMTAHYDTGLATARYVRPLGVWINQNVSFRFTVEFEILSTGFFADPDGLAQIAFGVMNSTTTGPDRAGGGPNYGDAFDVVSADYFPNVSPDFGGPTLGPTVVNRPAPSFFDAMDFSFNEESEMDDPGESPLPLDTLLTAVVDYDAQTRTVVLTVTAPSGALPINAVGAEGVTGGPDGDISTIQTLNDGVGFQADLFGLLAWEDTWAVSSSVVADVVFHHVTVEIDPVSADLDADGDVDVGDFAHFQLCFSGPAVTPPAGCQGADFDGDNDVDVADFAHFSTCFNGTNAAPACH